MLLGSGTGGGGATNKDGVLGPSVNSEGAS